MCLFHKWEYVGWIDAVKWLAGVSGGVPINVKIRAKQCKKCGETREV